MYLNIPANKINGGRETNDEKIFLRTGN